MSDVELLREAARILRAAADGATPGPWRAMDDGEVPPRVVIAGSGPGAWVGVIGNAVRGRADAALIALMGPDLARDLADWLDAAARDEDAGVGIAGTGDRYPLAVARRVVGGDA